MARPRTPKPNERWRSTSRDADRHRARRGRPFPRDDGRDRRRRAGGRTSAELLRARSAEDARAIDAHGLGRRPADLRPRASRRCCVAGDRQPAATTPIKYTPEGGGTVDVAGGRMGTNACGMVMSSSPTPAPACPIGERDVAACRSGSSAWIPRFAPAPGSGLGLSIAAACRASCMAERLRLEDNAPGLRVELEISRAL